MLTEEAVVVVLEAQVTMVLVVEDTVALDYQIQF
jgi:hypothetical protein